ncbi:HNH endonuclease family protein [Methylobacterium sp. C33D]
MAGYNKVFTDLISRLRSIDRQVLLGTLRDGLAAGTLDTVRWPDDAEFGDAWRSRTQYKPARQARLRHLFERLEERKRASASEIVEIKTDLTLEHIMPQKWRTHWPISGFAHENEAAPSADYLSRQAAREGKVHTLGNLTLLTHTLNAAISNGAFSVKMTAVRAQAALVLNRELLDYDTWDEDAITTRGAALFKVASQLWQAPPPAVPGPV